MASSAKKTSRRSSFMGGPPLLHKVPSSMDSSALLSEKEPDDIMVVDDAKERKARQRRRQSAVNAGGTPFGGAESPLKNAALLTEHYNNCIKLSAENKINVKNAFQLKLIDCMADLLAKKEMDNFQAASCALDASTKIYAYRVDSVHTDVLKLAGGVGSTAEELKGDSPSNEDQDDEDPSKKRTSKKPKRNRSTIEKNLKNVTLSKFEMEPELDSLFKNTTAQHDSGGGGGGSYFLNTLEVMDDDCWLVWDSQARIGGDVPSIEKVEALRKDFIKLNAKPGWNEEEEPPKICPPFEGFNFRDWKLEEDDLNSSIVGMSQPSLTSTQKDTDEHAFDINAPVPESMDDFDDDGGGGEGMDDFTAADVAMDSNATGEEMIESRTNVQCKAGSKFTNNLLDILTAVPLEYSYFDKRRMGLLAGPKHWKFRQPVVRAEEEDKKGRGRKKNVKEDKPLDFGELDSNCLTLDRVEMLMGSPKRITKIQLKTMQSWSEEKRLSPDELRYKGADFGKLFTYDLIPSMMSRDGPASCKSTDDALDDEISDYDFDNQNDAENFCPADMNVGDYDETPTISVTHDDGLVAAPNRVEKINIGYAKHAKKMDMKRLKMIEWDILRTVDENKENVGENESERSLVMSTEKSFSQIYQSLETSDKMPPKMIENLSVPLAFAALLHLCNEQSLQLKGTDDLSDFTISQD